MAKYGNKKTVIDNIVFDSKRESERYKELKLLERVGEICNLELQPEFLLQKSFKLNGKTERSITYKADFKYMDSKTCEFFVEDVKGVKTEVYKIKRKMFLRLYGSYYNFREVS